MKDWSAPQNASRVSTAALKPALRSLMVLTKAMGPAEAPYANAKSACCKDDPVLVEPDSTSEEIRAVLVGARETRAS